MKIGFASTDITPQKGVELQGYGFFLDRIFSGKSSDLEDRLTSDAMVLEGDNGRKIALTSLHLVGITKEISNSIKEIIGSKIDLSPEEIMISGTHTHSGPAIVNLTGAGDHKRKENQEYIQKLISNVAKTIIEANNSSIKGEIGFFRDNVFGVSHNRRNRKMYGPNLYIMKIKTGEKNYSFTTFACHPVTHAIDNKITRDYPGKVMDRLKREGIQAIWTTGCCGDINPFESPSDFKNKKPEDGIRISEIIAEKISYEFQKIPTSSYNIDVSSSKIELPFDEKYGREKLEVMENSIRNPSFGKFVEIARNRFEKGFEDFVSSEVNGFKIGEKIILGLPAEVCDITSHKILNINRNSIPVALTNDTVGYITDEEAFRNNFYEAAQIPFCYQGCPFTSDSEEIFINSVNKTLEKLY